jgi:hypothetical protein
MVNLQAAAAFMAAHARLLDRRRFGLLKGDDDAAGALAALEAYRNLDGGYGWGLEPDLRSASSQPGGALHAFEVFEDIAPATSPRAVELCDWLATASLPGGGLPFALPIADPAGCAPFWAKADPAVASLQITAVVAAVAHRVAAHDPAVAGHPWLAGATGFCLDAVDAIDGEPHALALTFALGLIDAVHDSEPRAPALLDRLAQHVPPDGRIHVQGGKEDEMMRPLDIAPFPGRPVRRLFSEEVVAADLRRLAGLQQDDGGWPVDFASYSPAAALEWRGHATVSAVAILRRNAAHLHISPS